MLIQMKPIKDYPKYYIDVSGNVWSKKLGTIKKLQGGKDTDGYHVFLLAGHPKKGHRLVAQAFIPNPNNYPCVCHLDNNPLNNQIGNLYWGTRKMNQQQASREKRWNVKPRKDKKYKAKLNIEKVKLIRLMHEEFDWTELKIRQILGKEWGISQPVINSILNYKAWKHA